MRYAVTGAAGFIGSHLAEALVAAGHDVVGIDCFTDYYDPALKEENARGLDVLRLDLAEDELDFGGLDGVFHLAGQPGVRSFGDVFPLYLRRNVLASQRVFEAAARDGVRVVFASSSSVYGAAERYPTPEDDAAAAALAVRDHEARLRASRGRVRARVRPRLRRAPLLQRVRPAAAARHGVHPDRQRAGVGHAASSSTATATSRAAGRTWPTSSTRPSRRSSGGSGTYNVGGAIEASLNEAIALLERISGRTLDVSSAGRPSRATSGGRAPTRPGSAPSSAGRRGSRSRTVSGHSGSGPRLESSRDERRSPGHGSRRRARDRPRRAGVTRSLARWWIAVAGLVVGRRPRRPLLAQRRHDLYAPAS